MDRRMMIIHVTNFELCFLSITLYQTWAHGIKIKVYLLKYSNLVGVSVEKIITKDSQVSNLLYF